MSIHTPMVVTTIEASKEIMSEVVDKVSMIANSWTVGFHSGSGATAISSSFMIVGGNSDLESKSPDVTIVRISRARGFSDKATEASEVAAILDS
jgi:hypothetical protein